ncbi:MAG TPA: hypothetical protein VFO94_14200 [Gammaproteobacteria bacterium]|nr:hypothetical protein [Gammaproteobacteria bacterium]
MKILGALLLSAALALPAAAQTNLAGVWQGELKPTPGSTLKIQFVISAKPDGGYGAVLTSPDNGAIKDVAAEKVAFVDGKLTVDVPSLSGAYAGTLRNGVFEGEWSQEGQKLPLDLRAYQKPVLTKADIDMLTGEWVGTMSSTGIEFTMVFKLAAAADGTFGGILDIPGRRLGLAVTDVTLENGEFSAQTAVPGTFKGRLSGNEIVGQWTQPNMGGASLALTVKKGKYVAPTYDLDLPAAAREQLTGSWRGTLGPLELIVRFAADAQGKTHGFLDVPAQNAKDVPITEASLTGAKLTFRIALIGAEYTGDVAGGTITGTWQQVGRTTPLTLTRN